MAITTGTADSETQATQDGVRRRDFINIAAVSAAGVGALTTLVPLVSQMAPSKDVLAESTTEVDLTPVKEGQAVPSMPTTFTLPTLPASLIAAAIPIGPDASQHK